MDVDDDVATGVTAETAFSLLGDPTRMAILRALWEADGPLGFSALRRRAGGGDSGNFSYHLTRLTEHFVRKRDGAYSLRGTGEAVVRAVVRGAITEETTVAPVTVPDECPFCRGTVELRYAEERVTIRCTECAGVGIGSLPRGAYIHFEFPPAGVQNRSPAEVLRAAHTFYDSKVLPMMDGVCPECAGGVSMSLDVCEGHHGSARGSGDGASAADGDATPSPRGDAAASAAPAGSIDDGAATVDPAAAHQRGSDERCPECGSRFRCWAEYTCRHCRYTRRCAAFFVLLNYPDVISFLHRHADLDQRIPLRKLTPDNAKILSGVEESVESLDPVELAVTFRANRRALTVTVDESLSVITVTDR